MFMSFNPPTRPKNEPLWEGGTFLLLRLRGEKKKALKSTGAAPTARSHGSPRAPQALVLLCVLLCSVPAYYLASRFVVTAVVIQGRSMSPTLKDGERYYLNRWRYLFLPPQRGDVIVLKDLTHHDFAVKRIIARPYDWLNLKDGNIYVNGQRLTEPYLGKGVRTDSPDLREKWIQLGRDQYYVLGDNRTNSEDSRFYGVIQRQNILGLIVR